MSPESSPDHTPVPTVVVLGKDPVVGQALELLLRSADCNVRFVTGVSLDEPGMLDGVQLLLVAPGLNAECQEALSVLADSGSSSAVIPILELVNDDREASVGAGRFTVPWPCRSEELKRQIEAALSAAPGRTPVGSNDGTRNPDTRGKGRSA